MRAVGSPQYLAETAGNGALSRQISLEAQGIENTLAILSPLTFDAVVARVACAPRVRVEREGAVTRDARGFRNSRFMADCARQMPMRLRGDVDMPIPPRPDVGRGGGGAGARRHGADHRVAPPPGGGRGFCACGGGIRGGCGAGGRPLGARVARAGAPDHLLRGWRRPSRSTPMSARWCCCARAQDDAPARAGWAAPFAADRDVARHAGAAGTTVFRP